VLTYTDAWLRVYMVWYQIHYQQKKQLIPTSYYTFKNRVKVKQQAALFQYEYLRFVRQELYSQRRQAKGVPPFNDIGQYARRELGENMGSFIEIWEKSLAADNPNWIESKLTGPFHPRYQYLIDYLRHRAKENHKQLKFGDKAPNFALVDSNDSLVTLVQFKGQVVYISFWFTTCGACKKEMPYENKLVEQFKGKPVKIISICTGTPGAADEQQVSKWKAASSRFGLQTIDLFANRSWKQTLSETYSVSAYPHYVLIGPDGTIIENFADRPSQGIAAKIEKAIPNVDK
jgi:peroxiredoxin